MKKLRLNTSNFYILLALIFMISCGKDEQSINTVNTGSPVTSTNWNNTNSTFSSPPLVNWSNSSWWIYNQNFYNICQGFNQNYFSGQTATNYWDSNFGGLGVNYYAGYGNHVYQYNNQYYYINHYGQCNNTPQITVNNPPVNNTPSVNNCGGQNTPFFSGAIGHSFHVHNGAQSHIDIQNLPSSPQEYFLIYKGDYTGISQTDEILYVERADGVNRTKIKDLDNINDDGTSNNSFSKSCYVSIPFCLSSSQNRIHIHSVSGSDSSQMTGYEITTLRPIGLNTCN